MKNPATELCLVHERITSRHNYWPKEAVALLLDLAAYEPFLATQPDSNIKVRQRIIQGGLMHISGKLPHASALESGLKMFNDLRRNLTWPEGPDYFKYTADAFTWLWDVLGTERKAVQDLIDAASNGYDDLVCDGDDTIPLPEARETKYPKRLRPHFVATPSYLCKRWPSGAYLLVCIDPVMEPRNNFHVAPACGYFALWAAGSWKVRVHPYTGWDARAAIDSNGLIGLLPKGAVDPTWRLTGIDCKVTRFADGVKFRWRRPWLDRTRTITWADGVVRVVDKCGLSKTVREWKC